MKKVKKSLSHKAVIGIIAIFLPIAITSVVVALWNKGYMGKRLMSTLEVIADAHEVQVYQFLEKSKQCARVFSRDDFIRSQLCKMTHGKTRSPDILGKYLVENDAFLDKSIKAIHIISPEGRVVAATNKGETGKDVSAKDFFIKGKSAVTITELYTRSGESPELAISAPIFTKDTDRLIGVLVNFIQLSEVDRILSGRYLRDFGASSWSKGMDAWETMEAYLVNGDKYMITHSRFVEDAVLRQAVRTQPVELALKDGKEMAGFYKDYRGVEVVGVSMYIPSMRWVLLVEIDKDEVLLPVVRVLLSSAITGSVVVAMIILLLILFLKRVVKPLRAITRTAISIANGNLDAVVPVTSNDEIGRLCESFNTMSEDIKTRTRSLLQSNKRLEEAQKTACLGNWERDIVKNELCWSDEIYRIFGLSPQGCSITYNEFLQYVHPDDREYVKKSVNNAISGMEPYEIDYRILPKNGAVRIIHEKALVVRDSAGKAIHIVGTIQDITERRQREEEVHLLQALILAVGSAKDMHDALAVTLEKVCSVTGWVYGETWVPCKDGRYLVRDYTFYNKIERLKKFSDLSAEYRFSPGVGLPGMVWLTKQPVWIEDVTVHSNFPRALIAKEVGLRAGASFPVLINGEVVAVIAFFMFEPCEKDERFVSLVSSAASQLGQVINRKHAEESLIKSEHLLQSILDNTTSVVYVKDIQGRYIFVNKQFEKLFHTTKDEIKGETDYDIWPAKIADAFRLNDRRVIESRTPIEFDEAVPHDDGQHSYISVKFPLFSVAGDVYAVCGISTDITERKSMEEEKNALREQLYHVQKLESVGKLAGGIAHDFNNILMAISGYCSLLEMEMKEDSPSGKCVQQILASAERGENLIRSLLIFSRKGEGTPKPEDLNKIVYNVADLLLKLIGENVKLDISPADKECIVMVDKGQIEQVLMNLATNARDAMPKGGALKISIETSVVDDTFIELHHYGKIGVYGVLSVSDTGTGMDEETKKKAFEPFFTTKGVGKGTGLGLSIVYGIIKHHEGYINIYSEPGKGTTFNIYLPAAKSKGEEEMSESLQTVKGGTETILLADDDANVRDVTALVLKKNGYKVIEAVNGEDALRKFAEYADKIQLLVLDIMMPGKNGKEVYDEIRKTGANVNALFMSGYAEDIISGTVIREEGLHFIAKPISPAKFLKKIRDVLDT